MAYDVVLAVPVMYNFKGFTELMQSVDIAVKPYVFNNWDNNHGVSMAWNSAIDDNQDADVLIISNDDIVYEQHCLGHLVSGIMQQKLDLVTAVNTRDFPKMEDCKTNEPDFACFAIDPVMFLSRFGYFDQNFGPAYFEDNDMAWRIKQEGGEYKKLPEARMFHKGSQTQFWHGEEERVVSHEQFRANEQYYIRKWGGRPGEERFHHHPFNNPDLALREWV